MTLNRMETGETITLDPRAQRRLYILNFVLSGALTADEAARACTCRSARSRRLLGPYRAHDGPDARRAAHRQRNLTQGGRALDETAIA